jgi:hypothetical protein
MLPATLFKKDDHEIHRFMGSFALRLGIISSDYSRCILYRRLLTASYGEAHMLESIAIILVILWILGLVSSYTIGGFIHILLVIAVIVIVLRVIQGRRI